MAEVSEERRKEVEERAALNVGVVQEYRSTGGHLSGPDGRLSSSSSSTTKAPRAASSE